MISPPPGGSPVGGAPSPSSRKSPATVSSNGGSPSKSGSTPTKRIREGKKCRKVYGLEQRDLWCTQCKWKKACARFGAQANATTEAIPSSSTTTATATVYAKPITPKVTMSPSSPFAKQTSLLVSAAPQTNPTSVKAIKF